MSLVGFDPFSSAFLEDPYTQFRELRDAAPVHFVESRNMWVLTRYTDIVAATRNTAVFSSTGGVGYDWNQRPMMPMYDPPQHTRMRRMVARHFTPAAIGAFKSRVESLVSGVVARALEAGTVDVVNDIGIPVSLGAMSELLGVPVEHRAELRRWSQGTVEDLAGALHGAKARGVDELRREFNVFLRSLIEQRRATRVMDGAVVDVISALVSAGDEEKLTRQELLAFCVLLLVAGYETTVNAISNGLIALLEHPGELRKLRADRGLLAGAVEEMVRYDSPVLSFFRNTLESVTLHGTTIPKGAKVMLAFASANRDERHFEAPDTFDVARKPGEHLGYGAGVHYCLGAPLARLQLTTLFGALIDGVGEIELARPVARAASVLFRGARKFHVHLAPPGRSILAPPSSPASSSRFATEKPIAVTPFALRVDDSALEDLRRRLESARWPDEIEWAGWDYGTAKDELRELTEYWRDAYDWRAQEAKLAALPGYRARIDDLDVYFVHARSSAPRRMPLLVIHGWPGTFLLFSRLVEQLTTMESDFGFDLVVVSLPGFPLSSAARARGMGPRKMADVCARLMKGLGYDRYGVVAEDIGASVASRMGLVYPHAVVGLHLNMPIETPPRDQFKALTGEEKAWLSEFNRFRERELTHLVTHSARPQTLAYGLADSPVGLAAWLLEKYRAWSDCGGDVETRFSKDDLLNHVMLYWVTGSIASSLRIYFESRQLPSYLAEGERIEVPTAVLLAKGELLKPPRRWIERVYNLARLTNLDTGGHFTAWEEPVATARDIRAFFGPLVE